MTEDDSFEKMKGDFINIEERKKLNKYLKEQLEKLTPEQLKALLLDDP